MVQQGTSGRRAVEQRHEWQKNSRVTLVRLILTTSYSEALTLPLHFAEKCSFSFVGYKIHDPKKKRKICLVSIKRKYYNLKNICLFLRYKTILHKKNKSIKASLSSDSQMQCKSSVLFVCVHLGREENRTLMRTQFHFVFFSPSFI